MSKYFNIFLATALALPLGSCDKTREVLGLKRKQPDEFQVLDRQPLSMPPQYGLRPPMPGAPSKAIQDPQAKAKQALLGDTQQIPTSSSAEKELLEKAAAPEKDPSIRSKLAEEQEPAVESAPGEDLVFWKKTSPKKRGDVIDPRVENEKYNGEPMPGTPKE